MLTSNRSDFRPYTRSASVTISNRRVRTRTHGGVAGVSGQPLPLCRSSLLLRAYEADFVRGRQFNQNKSPGLVLIDFCRTDGFLTGSIVRSTGYMVLHRPVELAGIIGMYGPPQ